MENLRKETQNKDEAKALETIDPVESCMTYYRDIIANNETVQRSLLKYIARTNATEIPIVEEVFDKSEVEFFIKDPNIPIPYKNYYAWGKFWGTSFRIHNDNRKLFQKGRMIGHFPPILFENIVSKML